MHIIKKGLCGLIGLLLLSGCASDNVVSNSIIQKRKYTNGYHVWGHGKKQKSVEPTATITYVPNTVIKHNSEEIDVPEQVVIEPETIPTPASDVTPLKKIKPPVKKIELAPIPNDSGLLLLPPKNNPYAVMSVAAGVGAILTLFIGAVLFSIALAVAAIVLANHGKTEIKRNPEKYTGKGLANLGLTLGFVVLGLMVIIVLLLLAFFI